MEQELAVGGRRYRFRPLNAIDTAGDVTTLPYSLKVLLENLLRHEDGVSVTDDDIARPGGVGPGGTGDREIVVRPGADPDAGLHRCARRRRPRRDARRDRGARRRSGVDQPARARRARHRPLGDRRRRPARPTRSAATPSWSSTATGSATSSCAGARAPSTGSRSCRPTPASATRSTSSTWPGSCSSTTTGTAYPDTLVGTDSHTPMVNGLGVVGWGVGGIEAEAAMLGQPISMLRPRSSGFELLGELPEGSTATDLVLTVTELLRRHGVVGKFVEFYGPGVAVGAAREPGHDRQHVARVRVDVHHLPDRRRDAALPALHRPPARAGRAGRGVRQGAGPVARPAGRARRYSEHLELDLSTRRAQPRRPEPARRTGCRSTARRRCSPRRWAATWPSAGPLPAGTVVRVSPYRSCPCTCATPRPRTPRPTRSRPATRRPRCPESTGAR